MSKERRIEENKKDLSQKLEENREYKIKLEIPRVEELFGIFSREIGLEEYCLNRVRKVIFEQYADTDRIVERYQLVAKRRKIKDSIFDKKIFNDLINELEAFLIEKKNDYIKNIYSKIPAEDVSDMLECLNTIDAQIKVTFHDTYVNKAFLVAYHYILRAIEERCIEIIDLRLSQLPKITKQTTPITLLQDDVIKLITSNDRILAFINTMHTITEQHLIKYSNSSKIGAFYYNVQMITMDNIIDKILKYLGLIAIKNKNPLELRAIFSTYITLIHHNIINHFRVDLSKNKIGLYQNVDNGFDDNNSYISINMKEFLIKALIKIKAEKHYKYKPYRDVRRLFNPLMSTNYFDVYYSCPENQSFFDFLDIYNKHLKYQKLNDSVLANIPRLHQDFNSRTKNDHFVKTVLTSKLERALNRKFEDYESTEEIISSLAKFLGVESDITNFIQIDKREKISFKEVNNMADTISDMVRSI